MLVTEVWQSKTKSEQNCNDFSSTKTMKDSND